MWDVACLSWAQLSVRLGPYGAHTGMLPIPVMFTFGSRVKTRGEPILHGGISKGFRESVLIKVRWWWWLLLLLCLEPSRYAKTVFITSRFYMIMC